MNVSLLDSVERNTKMWFTRENIIPMFCESLFNIVSEDAKHFE